MTEKYWASETDEKTLIEEIHSRADEYYRYLEESALYWLWRRSYLAYFGSNLSNSQSGQLFDAAYLKQEAQITRLKSNHFRNVIKHTLLLAVSQKAAWSCRASNSDYKSQAQTVLGNGLVDYYMREKKLGRVVKKAVEQGLVFSEGWVHAPWNKTGGEVHDVDLDEDGKGSGDPVYEGDMNYSNHSPLEVIRDIELEGDNHEWKILREYQNKWNLAAEFPEVADEILSIGGQAYDDLESFNFNLAQGKNQKNRVPTFILYHEKTAAMPKGRMVRIVGNVLLFDGSLPYRKVPLYCLKPDDLLESQFGYSPAFEILGIQQGIDVLSTAIMTNNASNAVQNLWTKTGDNLSSKDLEGGMKHYTSEEKPQAIQLTKTAPETFKFRDSLVSEMETLSGISATVRGNPEASLKSGSALALVVSQSIQFSSLLEESYNELIEDLGTNLIDNLRDFSKTPRVAAIIGEANRPYQKEFSGADLSNINRVTVERSSALSKTISGKIELANNLLEKGLIETAKQYVTVITTGQLDPAIEGAQHSMLNIRSENEDLRRGKSVQAVITENHADHIREHKTVIENPEAKKDAALVEGVLSHIDEHLSLWRKADMAILMVTGQQPPPPPPMPQNPMQPPPPPGNMPPPPQPNQTPDPSQVQAAPGPMPGVDMPTEPNMPTNPLTGDQFNNQDGGGIL